MLIAKVTILVLRNHTSKKLRLYYLTYCNELDV